MTMFFNIEWGGSADLTPDEVWPDGDAPENPTVEDVKTAMLKSGSLYCLARDWDMQLEEVEVYGTGGRVTLTDRTFIDHRDTLAKNQERSPDAR